MKYCILVCFSLLMVSCKQQNSPQSSSARSNFTEVEQSILNTANEIIENAGHTSLLTIDELGQPRARVMEILEPEQNLVIWMGTNPRSRKVVQIRENSKVTLHFFDKTTMGYVSLMGDAYIVNDSITKSQKWKPGWEQFYKNRKSDFMLIKFIPETLELIGMQAGYLGDSSTWAPHKVILRK